MIICLIFQKTTPERREKKKAKAVRERSEEKKGKINMFTLCAVCEWQRFSSAEEQRSSRVCFD